MADPALISLRAALDAAADRYSRDPAAALAGLLAEAGISGPVDLADVLGALAAKGSIDAVAALIEMSRDKPELEERAVLALRAVAERSPDVRQALVTGALETIVNEELDAQVAAGRLVRTIDPATGEAMYQRPEGSTNG